MGIGLVAAGILAGTFFLGVPLNGGTALIFLRRKKLRHLVNFLLLLDSLSHILLTLLVIPSRLISTVIFDNFEPLDERENFVLDFANIHGTLLTVCIGILRYRRLCWKKKDGFCLLNGIKWSIVTTCLAFGLTASQSLAFHLYLMNDPDLIFYTVKTSLSISSIFVVVWCYSCVCWRVLGNSHQEKLRRSRSLHIRAMVHSIIQILLLGLTIGSFIYIETLLLQRKSVGSKLNLLYGTTTNLTLLVTGTPLAYLASCHRFREEFTSLFIGHVPGGRHQKTSGDNKPNCRQTDHIVTTSSSGGGTKHRLLVRRPSTPRTLTSTTSSTSSVPIIGSGVGGPWTGHGTLALGGGPKPPRLHLHHLPSTIEMRTETLPNSGVKTGSRGHYSSSHRVSENFSYI